MDVSIILPTYNEEKNISLMILQLFSVLRDQNISGEIIVMDDNSSDNTAAAASQFASQFPVKVIVRKDKQRGLSASVIDGFKEASGQICLVMDADMSHPISAVPSMIRPILTNQADITVGSRHIDGGGLDHWPLHRQLISRVAGGLAIGLSPMSDPTSGFMAVRRSHLNIDALDPIGWKIVLETVCKHPKNRLQEIPIIFKDREHGESKLRLIDYISYIFHVVSLHKYRLQRYLELLKFCVVGLSGLAIDMLTVGSLLYFFQFPINAASIGGFTIAITTNYILNYFWTFADRKSAFVKGYFIFWGVCVFGLIIRLVTVNACLQFSQAFDSFSGNMLLNFIGILAGTISNFLGSHHYAFKDQAQ